MITFESIDDDILIAELLESISEDIIKMSEYSATYAVNSSPVDTGLFKGNWNVSINDPYDGSFINEDPSGDITLSDMLNDIGVFTLETDDMIYIQNSVTDLEFGEKYAETVAYDYSTATAESIISGAAIVGLRAVI